MVLTTRVVRIIPFSIEKPRLVVAVALGVEARAVGNLMLSAKSSLARGFRICQVRKSGRGFSTARHSLWETAPLSSLVASLLGNSRDSESLISRQAVFHRRPMQDHLCRRTGPLQEALSNIGYTQTLFSLPPVP
jgi:hypothetical protein